MDDVSGVGDAELVCELEKLVKADRSLSAKLLVHLGEVDARRLYCERGYSSMFVYCQSALGMSEGEAALRIKAARVGRRFPLVVERFGAGQVHLTAIKVLEPLLTQDNHVRLLDRARGMTKRQLEVLVADLAPKPAVPARIRKVPSPRGLFEVIGAAPIPESGRATLAAADSNSTAAGDGVAAPARCSSALTPISAPATSAQPSAATVNVATLPPTAAGTLASAPSSPFALQSPRPRATSTPLGLGRFKLQVTLGREAQHALDQLVELFRHQNPSGDLTPIIERAVVELLETKMKQRFGHTKKSKPRKESKTAAATPDKNAKDECDAPAPRSRHIPLAIRRAVHTRDNGQCTFVGPDGRRCTERGFLEVHHHNTTFARGGEATVENLRLTCRTHNLFFAEQDYGRELMQQKLREARQRNQLSRHPVQV